MMIDIFENVRNEHRFKEGVYMNNISTVLKDAVAVRTSLVAGQKRTRFERLADGRWYDWGNRITYDDDWFKNALSQMVYGKEYEVEYVG